jgi:hypothetical protein
LVTINYTKFALQLFQPPQKPERGKKRRAKESDDTQAFIQACTAALQSNQSQFSELDAVGVNVNAKLKKMNSNQQIYAELFIQKISALGLMEKLTAQTEVGVFQRDMTVPTEQCPCSPAGFVSPSASVNSNSSASSVAQYYENAGLEYTSRANKPLHVNTSMTFENAM